MWYRSRKSDIESREDSKKALASAKTNLEKTKARGPEIKKVAQNTRFLRERNHFSEQLSLIMGGRQ